MGVSIQPGPVILFGSGETSPSGRKIFDAVLRGLPHSPRVAMLETPAGFELNSPQVIGRVADFLRQRLQNYAPQVSVVAARRRGTPYSPDSADIAAPLLEADLIFMGPGSPSYAVRQLRDSLAWHYLTARHRLGAALTLASAAAVALSVFSLPVYEIYKVGEDLHWKSGLDFLGAYGLPLVFIPHWNNHDGGPELDTSRCFMGRSRFARLMELLPPGLTVVGIDEKTALALDLQARMGRVIGPGQVTLIHTGHSHDHPSLEEEAQANDLLEIAEARSGHVHQYRGGEGFPLSVIGDLHLPDPAAGLPPEIWQLALDTSTGAAQAIPTAQVGQSLEPGDNHQEEPPTPPAEVLSLVGLREIARKAKDWKAADGLRERIAALGWQVKDTPEGPDLKSTP